MTDNVIPLQKVDGLDLAHEAEAERLGAEFWNYGQFTGDDEISSKTSLGILTTTWDAKAKAYKHDLEKRLAMLDLQHLGWGVRLSNCIIAICSTKEKAEAFIEGLERLYREYAPPQRIRPSLKPPKAGP